MSLRHVTLSLPSNFRKKIVAINSPVIARPLGRGNPVYPRSFSGLLRRFAPRNDRRIGRLLVMTHSFIIIPIAFALS